jgi:hypothetical protein
MQWETVLSMATTLAVMAYAAGALRQRIVDLERRLDADTKRAEEQSASLREIRDRVIAIDEWRKHVPQRRVRRAGEAGA